MMWTYDKHSKVHITSLNLGLWCYGAKVTLVSMCIEGIEVASLVLTLMMVISVVHSIGDSQSHFTHKTESPWPFHFGHSHWWKRRSRSKFASHYAWGTNGVCEYKMDVKSTWIPSYVASNGLCFHGHLDYFQKPPLGGKPNTKPGDHDTPQTHNHCFILFYHVWGLAWIEIHWNSIWLRVRSHMAAHYTWGSVTTLHDFGGVLGWLVEAFFWALTISWLRLLARSKSIKSTTQF